MYLKWSLCIPPKRLHRGSSVSGILSGTTTYKTTRLTHQHPCPVEFLWAVDHRRQGKNPTSSNYSTSAKCSFDKETREAGSASPIETALTLSAILSPASQSPEPPMTKPRNPASFAADDGWFPPRTAKLRSNININININRRNKAGAELRLTRARTPLHRWDCSLKMHIFFRFNYTKRRVSEATQALLPDLRELHRFLW